MSDSDDSNVKDVSEVTKHEDRNGLGRFVVGNKGPKIDRQVRMRVTRYRNAIHDAITDEDMRNLALCMFALAMSGDVHAARILLEYAIGKPAPIESELETSPNEGSLTINIVPARLV